MTTTVHGVASRVGDIAAQRNSFGDVLEAHSYRSLSLKLPPGGIDVDLDHDWRPIGTLVYAERGDDQLRCVAVIDGDWLTQVDQPVYWSPVFELRVTGPEARRFYIAREAAMVGLSLTLAPATLAARPVEIRPGDVRSSVDRRRWPCSWRQSSPLLARAVDDLGAGAGVEDRHATGLVDRDRERELERRNLEAQRNRHTASIDIDWESLPPQQRPGWRPGDLEWSQAVGRVISVR